MTAVRHDFPLLLLSGRDPTSCIEPLSARVDAVLHEVAAAEGPDERLRRTVLQLEAEIRSDVAEHGGGTLASAWDAAMERLPGPASTVAGDLARAREAMPLSGQLVACDAALPARVVRHVWRSVQERRSDKVLAAVDWLASALDGLVRADFERSADGRDAERLRAGIGTSQQNLFDFDAMARLLRVPSGARGLSATRRQRIEGVLDTIRSSRSAFGAEDLDDFVFVDLDGALCAYEARLLERGQLLRALALAELEVHGRTAEPTHEALLATVDATAPPTSEELRLFPDYLVMMDAGAGDAALARILPALASGMPLKILVAFDDPFEFAGRLAEMAIGLGTAFVVQTAASHLFAARDQVLAALAYNGPALLMVYAPPTTAPSADPRIPGYLISAAAVESRAVPTFAYDPVAGPSWAQRLSLIDTPQPDRPWPRHILGYADRAYQRVTEEVAFTAADFAMCHPRWSKAFARPAGEAGEGLVPIDEWLAASEGASSAAMPFVYAVDGERATIVKLVVDQRLARLTRDRSEAWSRLRELAALGLPGEPSDTRTSPDGEQAADGVTAAQPLTAAPTLAEDAEPVMTAPVRGDDPYIDTPRCTTCNECTAINNRMFAYNENQQAFVADPDAGTYRELVEAAERCQVAIIHPGKPRNPDEAGLDELLDRAAPFA